MRRRSSRGCGPLGKRSHEHGACLRALDRRQREAVPRSTLLVPALLDGLVLERVAQLDALGAALDHSLEALRQARSDVSRRTAGVEVVRAALVDADRAAGKQREAERAAEGAEARWEKAREGRRAAESTADTEREALWSALAAWTAEPGAPVLRLPEALTAESVSGLPHAARDAASPRLTALRHDQEEAASRRSSARAEVERLTAERLAVVAEGDPAPPPPVLPRTERADGHALWQVVDFAEGVSDDARAGLEAALQAAGLLDAWVRPGGLLLDREHLDVVLAAPADAGRAGDGLDMALVPDLPAGTDLSADDLRRLSRRHRCRW